MAGIDLPFVFSSWEPAEPPVDLSAGLSRPATSWAARLADARAALAAQVEGTWLDLAAVQDGADRPDPGEADRAELVARYRAMFAL